MILNGSLIKLGLSKLEHNHEPQPNHRIKENDNGLQMVKKFVAVFR